VSPLTILELFSVYARILDKINLPPLRKELDDVGKLEAIVQASLIDCGLFTAAIPLGAEWTLVTQRITVPLEYAEARNLAARIRLRTLDLLHVSCASLLLKTGTAISHFVTGNQELVSRSDLIRRLTGIRVVALTR
jgi:hypothetical protein